MEENNSLGKVNTYGIVHARDNGSLNSDRVGGGRGMKLDIEISGEIEK